MRTPFTRDSWIFEWKHDGFRAFARRAGAGVQLRKPDDERGQYALRRPQSARDRAKAAQSRGEPRNRARTYHPSRAFSRTAQRPFYSGSEVGR